MYENKDELFVIESKNRLFLQYNLLINKDNRQLYNYAK